MWLNFLSVRLWEFAKVPLPGEHQVAQNKQRPAVPDFSERSADGASRSLIHVSWRNFTTVAFQNQFRWAA